MIGAVERRSTPASRDDRGAGLRDRRRLRPVAAVGDDRERRVAAARPTANGAASPAGTGRSSSISARSAPTPARSGAPKAKSGVRHRPHRAAERRDLAEPQPGDEAELAERHPCAGARMEEAVRGGDDHRRGAISVAVQKRRPGDVEPPDAAERRRLLGVEHAAAPAPPPPAPASRQRRTASRASTPLRPRAPAASARRSPSRAARRYAPPAPRCPAPICTMQPMLPAAITSGAALLERRHLARAQLARDLRLQQVVGPGRAAAEVGCRAARPPRSRRPSAAPSARRAPAGRAAASRRRDRRPAARGRPAAGGRSPISAISSLTSRASPATRAARRRQRVALEHVAVVLDRRAAARGVDHDGVEPLALGLARSRRGCSAPPSRVARARPCPCGGSARRSSRRPRRPPPRSRAGSAAGSSRR